MAEWLVPHFTEDQLAPVEIGTRILHEYLSADAKLLAIFGASKIIRLDFEEPIPAKVEKPPYLIVQPAVVTREPQPGAWQDMVRIRVIARVEWKGVKMIPVLSGTEPGMATLVNYVVGVCTGPRARKLTYTPTGKTQERGLANRMETPTVSVEAIEVPGDSARAFLDYIIDLDYEVPVQSNGWQARQQVAP